MTSSSSAAPTSILRTLKTSSRTSYGILEAGGYPHLQFFDQGTQTEGAVMRFNSRRSTCYWSIPGTLVKSSVGKMARAANRDRYLVQNQPVYPSRRPASEL